MKYTMIFLILTNFSIYFVYVYEISFLNIKLSWLLNVITLKNAKDILK